jgi:hypothetical protein
MPESVELADYELTTPICQMEMTDDIARNSEFRGPVNWLDDKHPHSPLPNLEPIPPKEPVEAETYSNETNSHVLFD